MVKRSRAFVLTELLITMMLQAGFIIVLCTSFYLLMSFYTKTQQVLTARSHAERVILFFDDKMRHAGLGLWRLKTPSLVRHALNQITGEGVTPPVNRALKDKILPIAVEEGATPLSKDNIYYGNTLTLLYAQKDFSSGSDNEINMTITGTGGTGDQSSYEFSSNDSNIGIAKLHLLDNTTGTGKNQNLFNDRSEFKEPTDTTNIRRWAVMEGLGIPFYLSEANLNGTYLDTEIKAYGIAHNIPLTDIPIPPAGELMYLKCVQMFVHTKDNERQFAFRELTDDAQNWGDKYNQEKGILEIYMELDTQKNIFTLWIMATGGLDYTHISERPKSWPPYAHPTASEWGTKVSSEQDYTSYPHNTIYVSRASWKLKNLEGFIWN